MRFLASGAVNTLVSWVIYAALLEVLPYRWSYTIAYGLGIAMAYLMYRYFVFKRSAGRLGALWVAAIYLVQYLLGLALVSLWVQGLAAPAVVAPLFAVAVTLPLTYLLNRWVFRKRCNSPPEPQRPLVP